MPGYAPVHPFVGLQQPSDFFVPDTVQRHPVGMVVDAVDPFFGFGRFAYFTAPLSAVLLPGAVMTLTDQTGLTAKAPSTANVGCPIYINRGNYASNATAQWGWFQFEGLAPVKVTTSVAAAAAIGLSATAGLLDTNAAGKQILGIKVIQPSTFAPTKTNCQSTNGSAVLGVPNIDGLVVGLTATGTGISGTISSIDPSGRFITLSANATATGSITATFTWTGFVLALLNNPHSQGAIT